MLTQEGPQIQRTRGPGSDNLRPRNRPGWRNGRRGGLKILCPKGRVGSNPTPGTHPPVALGALFDFGAVGSQGCAIGRSRQTVQPCSLCGCVSRRRSPVVGVGSAARGACSERSIRKQRPRPGGPAQCHSEEVGVTGRVEPRGVRFPYRARWRPLALSEVVCPGGFRFVATKWTSGVRARPLERLGSSVAVASSQSPGGRPKARWIRSMSRPVSPNTKPRNAVVIAAPSNEGSRGAEGSGGRCGDTAEAAPARMRRLLRSQLVDGVEGHHAQHDQANHGNGEEHREGFVSRRQDPLEFLRECGGSYFGCGGPSLGGLQCYSEPVVLIVHGFGR